MDKIKVRILKIYPQDRLFLCETITDKKKCFVKGNLIDAFPEDHFLLYGEFRFGKKLGRFFDVWFYREIVNYFWIAKWLKKCYPMSNQKIASAVIHQSYPKEILKEWKNYKLFRSILSFLMHNGVSNEIVAKIEMDFKWDWNHFLNHPYELLKYPSISEVIFQDVCTSFFKNFSLNAFHQFLFVERLLMIGEKKGHLFLPVTFIQKELKKRNFWNERFFETLSHPNIVIDKNRIYLKKNYNNEVYISDNLIKRLKDTNAPSCNSDVSSLFSLINNWEIKNFKLSENQKKAVFMALQEPVSIITGGPGVGKTTVCKCITDILSQSHQLTISAPTGRAAKRAFESTGFPAATIHRSLEYNGFFFQRNEDTPMQTEVWIFDESSMIDTYLLEAILKASPLNLKIIFVGDVDQLPSVGPGQVLRDMIQSGSIPVTRLTEIFRQAKDSKIITCAYAVNEGKLPNLRSTEDLIFYEGQTEKDVYHKTLEMALNLYRDNDWFDVQVLIPTYKGTLGIDSINQAIQKKLNSGHASVLTPHGHLYEGDKIIQTRNDYKKEIYNGDVGIITFCSESQIKVHFFNHSTQEVSFNIDDFKDLQLAYATSVHRAQGSEYPFVIMPLVNSYQKMLQKNLIYTAITRAKKRLWIPYVYEAFLQGVRPSSVPIRFSSLPKRIQFSA